GNHNAALQSSGGGHHPHHQSQSCHHRHIISSGGGSRIGWLVAGKQPPQCSSGHQQESQLSQRQREAHGSGQDHGALRFAERQHGLSAIEDENRNQVDGIE